MRRMDPTLDVVFKMLLLADQRLLRSMIESVFGLCDPLAEITVLNPELPGVSPDGHGVVLDVRLRLPSGEEIDLEMATRGNDELPPRMLFYWARHFSSQLNKGVDYRELRPVRSVLWTVRPILATANEFHEVFRIVGEKTGALFAPHFELHLLDLSRFVAAPGADNPQLLRWGRFFKLDSDEQAKLLAEEDPIMSLAVKTLQDLSDDPAKRRIAEDRERDLLAHGHNMAVARRVGRDEGIAIGKEEGIAIGKEAGIAIGKEEGIAIGKEEGIAIGKEEGITVGKEEGITVGKEEGIAIGKEEGIAVGKEQALLTAIEALADVLSVDLTPARRAELTASGADALAQRLDSLRRLRCWV